MARFIPPSLKDWNDRSNPPVAAPAAGGGLYPSTPNPGQGAFGAVPGSVDIPSSVSGGISRDLSGIVSPEVQGKLQNIAATWGIKNGMPGSGAQSNLYAHDYLGASDVARQRGFENWKSLVPLQQQNNELAAAPNPTQRALTEQSFAQQMFNQYLATLGTGKSQEKFGQYLGALGGSPAGGTGVMRTGGIDTVANPLPTATGGNTDVMPGGAPPGTWYDAPTDTMRSPNDTRLDPYSDYWDNLFNN